MTQENDIALIFLNNVRSEIEPVMLNQASNTPETAGDLLEVSGWGVTEPKISFYPNQYHIATLGYVPNDQCTVEGFDITSDMMCATSPSEDIRGPCTGDAVRVFDLSASRMLCESHLYYLMLTLNDSQGGPLIMDTEDGPFQVGVTSVGVCELQ